MCAVMFAADGRKGSHVYVRVCAGGIHQEMRRLPLRETDASDARALCDCQLDFASIGKRDGVVAGMRLFLVMAERESVVVGIRCRARLEFAGPGQDREVAIERAARTAEMGQAEAVDAGFV